MSNRCDRCGCSNHPAHSCINADKYWVGTQNPGRDGMKSKVAQRDFIVMAAGKPCLIRAGTSFWQNPQTKQYVFQRSPYPENGYSSVAHCSTCGSESHDVSISNLCPNRDQFWVSTQSGRNAVQKIAKRDFIVIYCGQPCEIKNGQHYWQDVNTKQVVVGWHGSVSPPIGMNAEMLVAARADYRQTGEQKHLYYTVSFPGVPEPMVNREMLLNGDFGVLDPNTFRRFKLIQYRGSNSFLDSHLYEVPLTRADSVEPTYVRIPGHLVFMMMKPQWQLYDLEIRRYFMEYRDNPSFSL